MHWLVSIALIWFGIYLFAITVSLLLKLLLPIPPMVAALSGLVGGVIGVFYYVIRYAEKPVVEYIDRIEQPKDPLRKVADSLGTGDRPSPSAAPVSQTGPFRHVANTRVGRAISNNMRASIHLTGILVAIVLLFGSSVSGEAAALGGLLGIAVGELYLVKQRPDHPARKLLDGGRPVGSTTGAESPEETNDFAGMIEESTDEER